MLNWLAIRVIRKGGIFRGRAFSIAGTTALMMDEKSKQFLEEGAAIYHEV